MTKWRIRARILRAVCVCDDYDKKEKGEMTFAPGASASAHVRRH